MGTEEPAEVVTTTSCSSSSLRWNIRGLALVIVAPMLGGFLYGFDIGATSFCIEQVDPS